MSDKDFSSEDKETVKETIEQGQAYDTIRFVQRCSFSEGDIVLRQTPDYDADWKDNQITWMNSRISGVNHAPQRYKVVHVDEFNIPWLKKVSATNGKLCGQITSLLDFNPHNTNFVADPDYANSILVGEDNFDPGKLALDIRKKNKEMKKRNKARLLNFKSLTEADEFIKSLSPGDLLWTTRRDTFFSSKEEVDRRKIKVVKIVKPRIIDNYLQDPRMMYISRDVRNNFHSDVNYVMEYIEMDWDGNWCSAHNYICCLNLFIDGPAINEGEIQLFKDEPEYAQKF